tara:strand:- start:30143 stop:30358 length:216 start_codon:yes stop_codon:yes gene_type:complete
MFEAMIVACHIGAQSACIKVEDQRGPYNTQEQCEARLAEITKDLIGMWTQYQLPFVFKGHYCTVDTDGERT